MKTNLGILAIFYLSAAIAEIVYLDDITGDHDKRNLRLGLPETMQFRLRRAANEVTLTLRENKHLNHNAPIYESVKDENGNTRIVRNTNIKPTHNVRYYQGLDNDAYMKAECMKREAGPCTRLLTGNLFLDGIEHTLEPAVNEINTRELNSDRGTPHELNILKPPEAYLAAAQYAREKRDDATRKNNLEQPVRPTAELGGSGKSMHSAFVNEKLVRNKRVPPVPHGIEFLLAIDHTIYNDFAQRYNGTDTIKYRIREYFSHIVNGVDTRYASINHPDISIYFVIAGFFISTKVAESPWMDYTQNPTAGMDGLRAMTNWRLNAGLPAHDLASLLTRSDIKDDNNDRNTLGIAWIGVLCHGWRNSINEDHGLFFGAHILAHEIGHNLGSWHDGDNGQCDPDDDFVMAPTADQFANSINEWRFSSCSQNSFVATIVGLGVNDCTLNQAVIYDVDESNAFLDEPAGTHFTLNEQCVLLKGTGALFCGNNTDTPDICKNFRCKKAGGVCEQNGASDGTPCGYDNICYESTCRKPDVCRYRPMSSTDIAKDFQVVSQSSEHALSQRPAALAVDGNLATISVTSTEDYPWWKVQFPAQKSVYAVKLWNRYDCCEGQLSNLQVRVDDTVCGLITGPLPKSSCFEVTCSNGPIPGTSVEIKQMKINIPLNIAEVQVFAGCFAPDQQVKYASVKPFTPYYRAGEAITYECDACCNHISGDLIRTCTPAGCWTNTQPVCQDQALYLPGTTIRYKNATQSSEHSTVRPATLAVDGSNSTISVTDKEDNPFWQIEFCTYTSLASVILTSRSDCCGDQFSNLLVTVDNITCGTFEGPTTLGATVVIYCGQSLTGKVLKITRTQQQSYLTLADVRISGQSCATQQANANIITDAMYTDVSQSSEGNQTANLAVDGHLDTFSRTTEEHAPWWEVQFCNNVTIGRVKIWHVDAIQSLFLGIVVDGQFFAFFSGSVAAGQVTTVSASAKTGKTLRISRPEDFDTILSLAEVQAFDV